MNDWLIELLIIFFSDEALPSGQSLGNWVYTICQTSIGPSAGFAGGEKMDFR